jgi:hypothetical protein
MATQFSVNAQLEVAQRKVVRQIKGEPCALIQPAP